MGVFDNLSDNGESRYFAKGEYIVEVTECKLHDAGRDEYAIIEGKIVEVIEGGGSGKSALKEGMSASQVFSTTNYPKMAKRDIMGFLSAVYGEAADEASDKVWKKRARKVFEDNGAAGIRLYLVCTDKKKKNSDGFVTKHRWHPEDDAGDVDLDDDED